MSHKKNILLVDDAEDDILLMKHACRAAKFEPSLNTLRNGEEAVAYLNGQGLYADRTQFPVPSVMLLDLHMPQMDGFGVLAWVRSQPVLKSLPVIILTSSGLREDVNRAFALGSNSYLIKPPSLSDLVSMICCLRDWLELNQFPTLSEPSM